MRNYLDNTDHFLVLAIHSMTAIDEFPDDRRKRGELQRVLAESR